MAIVIWSKLQATKRIAKERVSADFFSVFENSSKSAEILIDCNCLEY